MAFISRGLMAAAVGVAAIAAQGCVSADVHEQTRKQLEAHKAAYLAADAAVGNERKEKEALKVRVAALEKEVVAARERARNADLAVEASVRSLKDKYEQMIATLKNEQGGAWTINPNTGGVVLEDGIYFAAGRAELKADRFQALDQLIGKLQSQEFASAAIEIAGHTDADPIAKSGWKDNFQLSSERARAVLVYFQKKGIAPERLFISAYGPARPRSEKKSENRRVEIVLHERT